MSEPKKESKPFDPNAFIVDTDRLVNQVKKDKKFNPQAFIEETDAMIQASNPEITKTESLLRGTAQGLTGGFGDEASSGVQKLMTGAYNLFAEDKIPQPSYQEARDTIRLDNKNAEKSNPKMYMGGQIAGGVASTLPFGAAGSTIKGATLLGATNAAGTSEKQGVGLVEDTAKGAALGFGLGVIGKALTKAPAAMLNKADDVALKNLKMDAMTLRRLEVKGDVLKEAKEVARAMIDEGVLSRPSTANAMEQKAFGLMKKSGEALQAGYKSLDEAIPAGVVSKNTFKNEIMSRIQADNPLMDDSVLQKVGSEIDTLLSKLGTKGKDLGYGAEPRLGFNHIWDFVKELDDKTRIYERASDPAYETAAQVLNEFSSKSRGYLSELAQKAAPDVAESISKNASLYSNASTARKAFADTVRRGVLQNKAIQGQGIVQRMVDSTIGSTPVRGAATGILNTTGKIANFGKPLVLPASKGAVIYTSNRKGQ